jgi:hypothetical protein
MVFGSAILMFFVDLGERNATSHLRAPAAI